MQMKSESAYGHHFKNDNTASATRTVFKTCIISSIARCQPENDMRPVVWRPLGVMI